MNANDPAYPTPTDAGLTKRELFAAMAMQGILSNAIILDRHGLTAAETAHNALDFADSLIRALEKTND
jgi:hypothetical protein